MASKSWIGFGTLSGSGSVYESKSLVPDPTRFNDYRFVSLLKKNNNSPSLLRIGWQLSRKGRETDLLISSVFFNSRGHHKITLASSRLRSFYESARTGTRGHLTSLHPWGALTVLLRNDSMWKLFFVKSDRRKQRIWRKTHFPCENFARAEHFCKNEANCREVDL